MDCFGAIRNRVSIREYADRALDREILEKIVDAARLAPTARGIEPWEFVVIDNRARLAALADITDHGKFLARAAAAIVVLCKDTKYYLEDGCAATENILLAASALGLGACWIAGDKKDYAPRVIAFAGAGSQYKLISIISLGYPAAAWAPKEKRRLDEVLHWDKF